MVDACTLPRNVHAAEVKVAERLHEVIQGLDVDGCHCRSVVMSMNEFEKATGPSFDHWPLAIQVRMNKEIARFQEEHPKAEIAAVTQGVALNACVMAIHWRERK